MTTYKHHDYVYDWKREQCDNVEVIPDTRYAENPPSSDFICIVLGEKFCDLCRNKDGERCRYY